MTNERTAPRFRVSNIGYAFAVHDTAVRQEYAFEAGRDRALATMDDQPCTATKCSATFYIAI
jgi:hypothetical protein